MEFSIIIPTYKEEEYIERCLRSILEQNYDRSEYEIIVSDANSPDKTADIARMFADRIIIDERKGIAYGRNVGARFASGDILVFIDADVTLKSFFLHQCHKVFANHSIVGMTGVARPSDGEIPQRFIYHCTYWLVRLFDILGMSLFPGICVAFRRSVFFQVGGFREDFGVAEDLDLSRRISHLGKCIVDSRAQAFVSTRRLKKHWFSVTLFHIYTDLRYLITGCAPTQYPKVEEINSWYDLWKQSKS